MLLLRYACLVCLLVFPPVARAAISVDESVFVGGAEGPQGTARYRIPGFVVAPDGSLLAFAEGRRTGHDPGQPGFPIDMVAKRSIDGGRNWSPLTVLNTDPAFDYSDPRPIVDATNGTVKFLYTQWPDDCGQFCVPGGLGSDSSVMFLQSSEDNGITWSEPTNINAQVKDPNWRAMNIGPGSGIQLQWQTDPARNGRLVGPAHRDDFSGFRAVAVYSDDGGATWQSGAAAPGPGVNEVEVVELTNGDLLLDGRSFSSINSRARFLSSDGGQTWTAGPPGDIPVSLVDTSMIRYSAIPSGDDRNRILYSAPLGTPAGTGNGRTNIGVWTSYDEGKTFINPVQIADGFAAYSVLQKLPDQTIGIVYEASDSTHIRNLNFKLAHLEGGFPSSEATHYDSFSNQIDPFRGGVGWSGSWTNRSNVTIEANGGLEFFSFQFEEQQQHARLIGGTFERSLASPIDLDTDTVSYLSLFVRRDTTGTNGASNEAIQLGFQDGAAQRFAFGVDSSESLFVQNEATGLLISSSPGDIALDVAHLLLVKIVASDDKNGGNFDQIFLANFDDPIAVPDTEAEVNWALAGSTANDFTGAIDTITITSGSNATWNIDLLRLGTSFDSVMSDNDLSGVSGDINQDGIVNQLDVDAFKANWLSEGYNTLVEKLTHGDLNLDGKVNLRDVPLLHAGLVAASANGNVLDMSFFLVVPEPGSLPLLACGLLMALPIFGRRRVEAVSKPSLRNLMHVQAGFEMSRFERFDSMSPGGARSCSQGRKSCQLHTSFSFSWKLVQAMAKSVMRRMPTHRAWGPGGGSPFLRL